MNLEEMSEEEREMAQKVYERTARLGFMEFFDLICKDVHNTKDEIILALSLVDGEDPKPTPEMEIAVNHMMTVGMNASRISGYVARALTKILAETKGRHHLRQWAHEMLDHYAQGVSRGMMDPDAKRGDAIDAREFRDG